MSVDIAPVDQDELSRASATTYIEGASYLFYYDHTDNLLHMAVGLEGKNYQSGVIAVGKNKQTIHILSSNFPTPLAAGYDTQTKTLRVFYTTLDSTGKYPIVTDIISEDNGQTWDYGTLSGTLFRMAIPGMLTAYPGDIWRIYMLMYGNETTITELYEQSGSWSSYPIN